MTARSPSGLRTGRSSGCERSTTASTALVAARYRKLDPPVLAALRVAAYELGWNEAPAHAVADDAVELVRAAGLERATGFTNAVARRLAEGFRGLVAGLPEGPLKHSYPDWIYETWVRDWGVGGSPGADAHPERAQRARRPLGRSGR